MKKNKCIYYIFLSFFYLQVGDILFFARAAWNKKGDYICSYRGFNRFTSNGIDCDSLEKIWK